jgi:hypothetical protein
MAKSEHVGKRNIPIRMTRHIRWNWEQSPERDADNNPYVRYHFVVVDDRNRAGILNEAVTPLSSYGELIPLRSLEGKAAGTRYRYLLSSFDSKIKPDFLRLHTLGKVVIMDPDLKERIRGNIEAYVDRVYSS